ncbi:hypothetical protein Ade02nite_57490 [Paractinoplanes deccanensis]|uniref:Transposase n=1 Tax=Paractinoplanes deccanensis TaxID=113561 RepID=A0ABQ3YAS5_9ACTN|nr:hypothetical protein Ade02nite_57490 [Actinoplanes deccanensis]
MPAESWYEHCFIRSRRLHRDFGANIQAIINPDGLPIWTADALPGHLHDLSCARELGVTRP